jgi:hypothetical protein
VIGDPVQTLVHAPGPPDRTVLRCIVAVHKAHVQRRSRFLIRIRAQFSSAFGAQFSSSFGAYLVVLVLRSLFLLVLRSSVLLGAPVTRRYSEALV